MVKTIVGLKATSDDAASEVVSTDDVKKFSEDRGLQFFEVDTEVGSSAEEALRSHVSQIIALNASQAENTEKCGKDKKDKKNEIVSLCSLM